MFDANKFWMPLKTALRIAKTRSWWELAIITLALPLLEGILTNVWTSAPPGSSAPAGWALLLVAILHLSLGALVLAGQSAAPQALIAEAVELEERFKRQEAELFRRETTYRLMREAFDRLNSQTCSMQAEANSLVAKVEQTREATWCSGGYCKSLQPILEPFIKQVDVALGIKSMQFTLEAWFQPGYVSIEGPPASSRHQLELHFFFGSHVKNSSAQDICPTRAPCSLGHGIQAYEQHIDNNKQLFYTGNTPWRDVYFRRYAVCPITFICCDDISGVLVLTSMQNEPFAEDVLDTLAFFTTLISRYTEAYEDCFWRRQEYRQEALQPSVPTVKPAKVQGPQGDQTEGGDPPNV